MALNIRQCDCVREGLSCFLTTGGQQCVVVRRDLRRAGSAAPLPATVPRLRRRAGTRAATPGGAAQTAGHRLRRQGRSVTR